LPIPARHRILAADCPEMQAQQVHDVCGIYFLGLAALPPPRAQH